MELEANVATDEDNDDANSHTHAKPDAAADVYISTNAGLMFMLKQMLLLMPMLMLGDAANERAIRATRAREQGGPKNSHP